jgi:hypothetical protein
MQIVSVAPADAAPKQFTLNDVDGNRNGDVRVAILLGSVFDSKTLSLEVQAPGTANWYATGVNFAAMTDTAIVTLRPNYTYRINSSSWGGALAVSLMFF